jgi:hypothetical protein
MLIPHKKQVDSILEIDQDTDVQKHTDQAPQYQKECVHDIEKRSQE